MSISQVYEGWKNNVFRSSDVEEVAKFRLDVCSKCTYHSEVRKQKLNYSTLRPDEHCVHCGCTLSAKTRCLSCECPLGLWKAVQINEDENREGSA
jgi:hypothetical protein